ncbi:MAG: MBL fold metallo-hydrolase [Vicinamibacteria bacterium]|nr:MBL fold metallo-hydrolase [Vicinamibacteria bacterium]
MDSSSNSTGASPLATIDVAELLPRLDRGEEVLLLDVRNQEEYEGWKLEPRQPVETVHVPYFDFIEDPEAAIARVPHAREVVVLCAKGGSSETVVDMLKEAGLLTRNVTGGMVAYGEYLDPTALPLEPLEAARFSLFQVNRRGKGCLSYVIVSGGEAVVVDPSRNVSWYEAFVAERGARYVRVLDTHVHADHVSGGPELARRLGVPYSVSAGAGFVVDHAVTPLSDGEQIRLGGRAGVSIEVRAIRTPGHTPGSTSFFVDGRYLLTGDTLFVASVGRPDLGGHAVEWGRDLFFSLRDRLGDLPPDTRVLPAHYGGASEISDTGLVWGRLGDLRSTVPELQIDTPEEFVRAVSGAVTDPPAAYAEIIKVNLGGSASEEQICEWELGKNQCAAASGQRASGA